MHQDQHNHLGIHSPSNKQDTKNKHIATTFGAPFFTQQSTIESKERRLWSLVRKRESTTDFPFLFSSLFNYFADPQNQKMYKLLYNTTNKMRES